VDAIILLEDLVKIRRDEDLKFIKLLTILMFVVGLQSIVIVEAASAGPFRLAVVQGDWVEYIVAKSVNASTFCYTLAPEGNESIIFKPLNEGDRTKIVVRRIGTGRGEYSHNNTLIYVTEGFASSDLYLNGQMLWSADSMMDNYRPMGLDFHYVVGDGYWDAYRNYGYNVTVGDPNVTISYSYLLENGDKVNCCIIVNRNTGVVLESSRISSSGECQLKIVDTNIAGLMPIPWYIRYWYIFVLIALVAVSALSIYVWKLRKATALTRDEDAQKRVVRSDIGEVTKKLSLSTMINW